MQNLFSPDSKIMQYLGRLGDLMLLNFFFLVTCIPVVTIGAALTAMYTVCFRFDTERERGTVSSYFEAFRANFKQSTVLWLILLLCIGSAGFNTVFFYVFPGAMHSLWRLFAFLMALVLLIFSYTFPLLSQFENSCKGTLKNALLMSVGYLPRSIVVVALNVLPGVLLLTNLYVFFQVGFIWLIVYFAAAAYLNSRILKRVFDPYQAVEA